MCMCALIICQSIQELPAIKFFITLTSRCFNLYTFHNIKFSLYMCALYIYIYLIHCVVHACVYIGHESVNVSFSFVTFHFQLQVYNNTATIIINTVLYKILLKSKIYGYILNSNKKYM